MRNGTDVEPWARVTVKYDDEEHTAEASGNGTVHAVIQALKGSTDTENVVMQDFRIHAISGGADAQGRVSLSIVDDALISRGQATDIDVVMASAKAFISALNHREYQIQLQQAR